MTRTVVHRAEATPVERVFREAYGQAVATLIRIFGDITLAEDAVQDAFVVASDRWRRDGIPPNPAGWIVTTARNRAIDGLRRSARGRELHEQLGAVEAASPVSGEEDPREDGPVTDDRLRLIFTCCHRRGSSAPARRTRPSSPRAQMPRPSCCGPTSMGRRRERRVLHGEHDRLGGRLRSRDLRHPGCLGAGRGLHGRPGELQLLRSGRETGNRPRGGTSPT